MAKSLLRRGENLEPGMQCPRPCPQQDSSCWFGLLLSAQPWAQLCVPGADGYPA